MAYEKIEENSGYLRACENVKKIVNAIKIIKMKYYTNFAKISEEDKRIYDELEENLEKISDENNLGRLKTALMEEISAKYDNKEIKNKGNDPHFVDNKLLACYGNVDVQQKAIAAGKIGQARKCQIILEQYLEEMDNESYRNMVTNYKREKFAELVMERVAVEEKNEEYMDYMKGCFSSANAMERKNADQKLEEAKENVKALFDKESDEKINDLELQIV